MKKLLPLPLLLLLPLPIYAQYDLQWPAHGSTAQEIYQFRNQQDRLDRRQRENDRAHEELQRRISENEREAERDQQRRDRERIYQDITNSW